MKYTKLFNKHDEYVAYTASTEFIIPNVSYCIQEDEPHCTPPHFCQEVHIYEIMGEPSYPSSVAASATSFDLSFNYIDSYTAITCDEGTIESSETVSIEIDENPSTEQRTVSGVYIFNGISIPYSLTQEGQHEVPYSQRYLTFDVLTSGNIEWKAKGGCTKTISYSINDGEWTEITSTTAGTIINVSAGDKVRFKGTNSSYATAKDTCSSFSSGTTAHYNVEGNVMSLIGGDNFSGLTSFNNATWVFHSLFDGSNVVSAENLVLPVTTLTAYCYRAMFANCSNFTTAPELLATTLAEGCYLYMFSYCTILKTAPELNAETLVTSCYQGMFRNAKRLNYIKCMATSGLNASSATTVWVNNVAATGTFVKDHNTTTGSSAASTVWTKGDNGIPSNWLIQDESTPDVPTISCDGREIELSCATTEASIYYQLDYSGGYSAYTTAITMTADTFVECYAEKDGHSSTTTSMTCEYDDRTIFEYSNQSLDTWTRSGSAITVPNSVNAIDGHSSNYSKGTFNYETSVNLRSPQPTYLWFQHADQSADIYVDNVEVEKHWGGYNAFFVDISNSVHKGTNNIKVVLKNNEGDNLAPASGDFNFNATLGEVKLYTSPCLPVMNYGYDGFHITSTVSTGSAAINVATNIPTGASVVCTISGVNCNYTATSASTGNEMIFTTIISNPRLWNGTIDPYLYNVKLEVYYNNELYHRYERPYGLRFYEYVINQTVNGNSYTGFLLNGQPYPLRGCCMHDDIAGKANALNAADYTQQFNLITDLGLNFLRLAHYPHPKEVYDWCDRLGIIVESEVPCVNNLQITMPEAYWTHLVGQYNDMVNQHYNHPCIMFWGLSNEAKVTNSSEGRAFAKEKIEGYVTQIKNLDNERLVGLVAHALTNPIAYFGGPTNIDWIGSNLYDGWYQNTTSNNPTSRLNTCISNTVSSSGVAFAFSEYGCGGTQRCHSESASTTTNKGSGGARHDIEYQMWLHEGHIAAIKNKPQLLFSAQWVLFDFAVSNRNEGYTVCLDGENTSIDESLRRLNDKGLVERDHVTKKDPFYLYKAWWNTTDKFVHICGKNYQKVDDRVIKCYTNETGTLTMYVNGVSAATATVTDNIAIFAARNFNNNDTVMVSGATTSDTFSIKRPEFFCKLTLSDSTIVKIEGSGTLTSAMTKQYSATTVSAEIGTSCTSIGNLTFENFHNLSSCTISDTVTSIGDNAFDTSDNLTSCTIGSGVTSIGSYAFRHCKFTDIVIPSSVTSIGNMAFYNNTGVTSITVEATTPPTLGDYAFDNTNSCPIYAPCESVNTYKAATNWSVYASRIQEIQGSCHPVITAKFNVTDTSSPTKIANVISNFSSIEVDGVAQQSVTTGYTFSTSGEHTVKYYLSDASISSNTFNGCSALTSVTVSDNVTSIGYGAFNNCSGFIAITVDAAVPPTLGGSPFNDTICFIYAPSGSVDTYKAASGWGDYASIIRAIGDVPPYDYQHKYLQGDGHQYIDTNITPNSETGIYIKLHCTKINYAGSNDYYFVGLRNNTSNTRWCLGKGDLKSGGRSYWGYGQYSYFTSSSNISYNSVFETSLNYLNSKKATCESGAQDLPTLSFTPNYPIRIFGSSGVGADYTKASITLYACKISQGSNIVMDLIPVSKNGVGYLYDRISGTLYGNNGTSSFTLGAIGMG